MSNVQSYQKYLSSEYPGYLSFIENIIEPIFGSKFEANAGLLQKASNAKLVDRFENIIRTSTDEQLKQEAQNSGLTSMIKLGSIELDNTEVPLLVYDITISESKDLAKNRKGIQSLTRHMLEKNSGSFMIFHYADKQWEWRFSYCFKGMCEDESTNAKRFTYLLGPNQACRTAAQRFDKLHKQNGNIKLQDIEDAFNVEALSKEFFDQYRLNYADIVCYVTGKRMVKSSGKWEEKQEHEPNEFIMNQFAQFTDPEKAVRDYVKKLMGRLVFLQFIQKKGWLGVPMDDASWIQGDKEFIQHLFAQYEDKDNFIDDVLEPLFNDINTRRTDDLANPVLGDSIKVPYLNGGLFEKDAEDDTTFPLPAKYMQDMLDFFSAYNFTIDENDPNDAEVGVDPEMLGRVFENLLEDNKDKGAFYTPKEIVQYMCRESLIAYLQTDIEDDATKQSFRDFVTTHEVSALNPADVYKVDKKLREVKICDPAIGSGAFPMGLLKELFDCRMSIEGEEEGKTLAEIKKDIIQNSIYGVDIEKGAVDIARLRFWLSLIIDEQTPHALPNMDFKIMQGNSLLEQYEGVDLSGMSFNEQEKIRSHKKKEEAWQPTFAFDEEDALRNIQKGIKEYYHTDSHMSKVSLRKTIDENVKSYILNFKGCTPDIQCKLKTLPIPNDQFFLWHIYFKEVFDMGGFDIVIGNPPYINVELIPAGDKEVYKKYFKCFYKRSDIFALFLENALMNLSNKNAVCTFIIPSVVHSNLSYQPLRDTILKNKWLKEVCYTGGNVFNAPTVDTTILIIHKIGTKDINLINATDFSNHVSYNVPVDYFSMFNNVISIGEKDTDCIFGKLFAKKHPVMDSLFTIYQGIVTGNNPAFIFETKEDALEKGIEEELLHPMCHGRDIERYAVRSRDRQMMYLNNSLEIEDYPNACNWLLTFKDSLSQRREAKKGTIKWFCLQWPRIQSELDLKEKILVQNTRNEALKIRIAATLDDQGVYGTQGLNFIIPKTEEFSLRYVLGILNSTLINYLFSTKFLNLAIKADFLKQVHIPKASKTIQQSIEYLVDHILSAKKSNPQADTSAEEQEIDQLVYKLYNLTPEEIAIVEGKNE